MRTVLKYCVYLVFLPVVFSCEKDNTRDTIDYKILTPFDKIELYSVFHVYLKQDTVFSIRVVGNKEYIDGVEFTIENGILSFYNETKWMWLRPEDNEIELHISADSVKKVSAYETCLIETVNPIITYEFGLELGYKYNEANLELNCHTFYYWNDFPCGGKLTLKGNTRELKLWNFALMSVDAANLTTDYALIDNYSQGDCRAFVKDILEYSIHGKGNIYLYGEPNQIIAKEITDSGKLIRVK
jgi:hypothetical protein